MLLPTLLLALASADNPEVRPELAAQLATAEKQVADFEEEKALAALEALAQRKDLTSAEFAQVQLWRGVAQASLLKEEQAKVSFGMARGCNGLLEPPASVSPKIRSLFLGAVPDDCPAARPKEPELPEPVAHPAPKTAAKTATKTAPRAAPAAGGGTSSGESTGGGLPLPVLTLAGAGVAAAGVLVGVLGAVALAATAGVLVGSFPVLAQAQAAEKAKDARQMAQVAGGMRLGGGALGAVAVLLGLAGIVVAGGGGALAVVGFVTR